MNKIFLGSGLLFSSYYLINKQQSLTTIYKNSNKLTCTEGEKAALCILESHNSSAKGLVLFKQKDIDSPTTITGKFSGLKSNSKHGFHIHQYGDRSEGCITAGPHFNPTGQSHGGPEDEVRHVGDLGNLQSDSEGNATYERTDQQISLVGKYSILGRSMVVHNDEDDLGRGNFQDSKTTGHSGSRIACGIIALCDPNKNI